MAILSDFHLHSYFSADSVEPAEDMVKRGIDMGFTHICFTEHFDYEFGISPRTPRGYFIPDMEAYRKEICSLGKRYKDEIKVGIGIEIGMQPHLTEANTETLRKHDLDFVIGSIHTVKKLDPIYTLKHKLVSDEQMYLDYFEELLFCYRDFDEFDVAGHIDYIIRYGENADRDFSYEKYGELFDNMIETLVSKGKGIEINTGAVRAGLRELHPNREFLKRYRKRGGEIVTVGSDAHKLCDVGCGFNLAEEVLKECGFKYYCTFENRKPVFHKIG